MKKKQPEIELAELDDEFDRMVLVLAEVAEKVMLIQIDRYKCWLIYGKRFFVSLSE